MKGELRLKALEFIKEGKDVLLDLVYVTLTAPYGSSISGLEYHMRKRQKERRGAARDAKKRKQFRDLLAKLKRDRLITTQHTKEGNTASLTRRGLLVLTRLKNRAQAALPSPQDYALSQEKILTLVTFDIPEQQARKRVWLRKTLIHLGFSMLQKSVWLSTHPLPKDLISDLQKLGILDNVEILAITKTGSIRTVQ